MTRVETGGAARRARVVPPARIVGRWNPVGLRALAWRETKRFLVVWVQALLGPVIATLLFLVIFAVVIGARRPGDTAGDYLMFLGPGLIMMAMLQNAFANTSSSILIAKLTGSMADILMAPLRPIELVAGYVAGAVARAVLLGAILSAIVFPLTGQRFEAPGAVVLFGVVGALLFALLGIVAGIWARKMEHVAFTSQVVVAPLTMLSGAFYSARQLPPVLQPFVDANPIFHLIDGFRGGFLGNFEADPVIGAAIAVALTGGMVVACRLAFARGWGLKD